MELQIKLSNLEICKSMEKQLSFFDDSLDADSNQNFYGKLVEVQKESEFKKRLRFFGENNPWIEWEMNRLKNSIQPRMKQQES